MNSMGYPVTLVLVVSFFCLSCGGGDKHVKSHKNSEDSAAILQEIRESKKILEDRAIDEKAAEDSLLEARIAHTGEYLNGGWFCILNNEYKDNTRTFDLYIFDFNVKSEIVVHKMILSDNGTLNDYIQQHKSYGLPFEIKDEITKTNAVRNAHKTTYMIRRDAEGEKFLLTLIDGSCQSLSFFSEYNGEVLLSRMPNVLLKNREILEVFPADISMSDKSAAISACAGIGVGWRLPDSEEFEAIYNQIFRNNTYSFKRFFYWTSSQLNQPRFDIVFDTRFGKITSLNNPAYVRPVRKKRVFSLNEDN